MILVPVLTFVFGALVAFLGYSTTNSVISVVCALVAIECFWLGIRHYPHDGSGALELLANAVVIVVYTLLAAATCFYTRGAWEMREAPNGIIPLVCGLVGIIATFLVGMFAAVGLSPRKSKVDGEIHG